MQTDMERLSLGRRLTTAAPRVAENVARFHAWLPVAAQKCPDNKLGLIFENGRVVSVEHPLGRFDIIEEYSRVEGHLVARILFCAPPTRLRTAPMPVFAVAVPEHGAHFGDGAQAPPFEVDPDTDGWYPRNILRLAYEIALAATDPSIASKIGA